MAIERGQVMRYVLLIALASAGCGPAGPAFHAVRGKVTHPSGAGQLVGHHVEAALESDPTVTASGVIGPDGVFALESLHGGQIRRGARGGAYRVRIYPADEGEDGKRLPRPPVARRYLELASSGLTLNVPPRGEVVFQVAGR